MRTGVSFDLDLYARVFLQCLYVTVENILRDFRQGRLIKVKMYVLKGYLRGLGSWSRRRFRCGRRWWYRLRLGFGLHRGNRFGWAKGLNFADRIFGHIDRFLVMACHVDLIGLVHLVL